jgi:hypothetical protein
MTAGSGVNSALSTGFVAVACIHPRVIARHQPSQLLVTEVVGTDAGRQSGVADQDCQDVRRLRGLTSGTPNSERA